MTRWQRPALAGGAAVAVACAAAGLFLGVAAVEATPSGPPAADLGTPAQCGRYGGLPPRWGDDPKAGMAAVRAGEFTFGSERGYADERPAAGGGKVAVAAFWIDRTEVTVAQFASFVRATGYVTEAERQGGAVVFRVPGDDELRSRPYAWWSFVRGADWRHPGGPGSGIVGMDALPVTFVTEADALAYARWLGRDLPTEAEWEYAAKGGRSDDALDAAPRDAAGRPAANYWQGAFPAFNAREDGHAGLAPVGCYAANAFGLHDTIGNVWEWTRDAHRGPHQPHLNGDTALVAGRSSDRPMVIKGGSYLCSPDFCVRYRASAREAQEADLATAHIGFRTVLRAR